MVVPDRIVQHEGTVSVPPRIPGVRVLLQDDGRDIELLQPRPEHDAALSTADHDAVGLPPLPECPVFGALRLEPSFLPAIDAMLNSHRPRRAFALLEALELLDRSEQRPGAAVLQPKDGPPTSELRLELYPCFENFACNGRLALDAPGRRTDRVRAGRRASPRSRRVPPVS